LTKDSGYTLTEHTVALQKGKREENIFITNITDT